MFVMSQSSQNQRAAEDAELREMFPLVKNWRQLYTFVLVELVVLIGLFAWFSAAYAP